MRETIADRTRLHRSLSWPVGREARLSGLAPGRGPGRSSGVPGGVHGQCQPLGESAGVGKVGGEAKRLLGGAEGVGWLVVGLEGQRQVVVDVGPVGKAGGGRAEVFDRLRKMPQYQMGAAAEVAGLGVVGGELHDLVEPRQRLIGLVPGQLNGRDPEADLGIVRLEFQDSEVFRQGLVGPADASSKRPSEKWALGRCGSISIARLEPLEGGCDIGPLCLDLPQADQGLDIIGVALQRGSEAGFGLGQPALELARPCPGAAGSRPSPAPVQASCSSVEPGLLVIAAIDGLLGLLADLLGPGGLLGGRRRMGASRRRPIQLHPAWAAQQRKQKPPLGDDRPATHGKPVPSLGLAHQSTRQAAVRYVTSPFRSMPDEYRPHGFCQTRSSFSNSRIPMVGDLTNCNGFAEFSENKVKVEVCSGRWKNETRSTPT